MLYGTIQKRSPFPRLTCRCLSNIEAMILKVVLLCCRHVQLASAVYLALIDDSCPWIWRFSAESHAQNLQKRLQARSSISFVFLPKIDDILTSLCILSSWENRMLLNSSFITKGELVHPLKRTARAKVICVEPVSRPKCQG